MCAVGINEVSHFADVRVPDDPTKARERLVGDNDTAASVVVHLLTSVAAAKDTIHRWQGSVPVASQTGDRSAFIPLHSKKRLRTCRPWALSGRPTPAAGLCS